MASLDGFTTSDDNETFVSMVFTVRNMMAALIANRAIKMVKPPKILFPMVSRSLNLLFIVY
jgi:hypothetical protein